MDRVGPAATEVEISVIGRGYGECIVVHLGWGDWLVVDCCLKEKEPPAPYPALYLDELSVGFENVLMVLASHWDDDHVAGIGALTSLCGSARFLLSDALHSEEFLRLVLLPREEPSGRISSGVREMRSVLDTLKQRKQQPEIAVAGQRCHYDVKDGIEREVWVLSPSNAASLSARQAFASRAFEDRLEGRTVSAPSPNEASVALYIRVGAVRVLLGADLENRSAPDRGWNAVLDLPGRPRERASLFKVSHHGAPNGDNPRVWAEMLDRDVIAALTPYGRGARPRPDDDDVKRILAHTQDAYIAGPRNVRLQRASGPAEKIRRKALKNARVAERPFGHIRLRSPVAATAWAVELEGAARPLRGS